MIVELRISLKYSYNLQKSLQVKQQVCFQLVDLDLIQ